MGDLATIDRLTDERDRALRERDWWEAQSQRFSDITVQRDRRISELETALQPFANLRVEANGETDGPDVPTTVATGRNKAVTDAIPLGVYDSVIPARYVYAARRTLQNRVSPGVVPCQCGHPYKALCEAAARVNSSYHTENKP